jgi:hypothetical protein
MPLSVKLIICALLIGVGSNAWSVFVTASIDQFELHVVRAIVQAFLAIGFYYGNDIAWQCARVLLAIGIFFGAISMIILRPIWAAHDLKAAEDVANLALTCALLYLVGREDTRRYFDAKQT